MQQTLVIIFFASLIMLILVLLKNKEAIKWISLLLVNTLVASLLLFLLNVFDLLGQYFIPVNIYTVLTVALFGVPGLLLMLAVKFFLLP